MELEKCLVVSLTQHQEQCRERTLCARRVMQSEMVSAGLLQRKSAVRLETVDRHRARLVWENPCRRVPGLAIRRHCFLPEDRVSCWCSEGKGDDGVARGLVLVCVNKHTLLACCGLSRDHR